MWKFYPDHKWITTRFVQNRGAWMGNMTTERYKKALNDLGYGLKLLFWREIARMTTWLYLHRSYKPMILWGAIFYVSAFLATLMTLSFFRIG